MDEVTREEFDELHELVLGIHSNLQTINKSMMKYAEDHVKYIESRGIGEKMQSDWVIQWHSQVTAQTNALCAISATCALLLTEAGVEIKSITESIENASLAIPPEMRQSARPIFDAVLDSIRGAV